jgi:hypothetical protein
VKPAIALLFCAALAAPALAEESTKEMFKKAEKGAGQLFQGMGQEIKKAQDSMSKGSKKDDKKPEKPKDEKK